jgi:NTE family protein
VLSGGGVLGALQVGQMRALVEAGITPDLIVGTSVGALNGATFAARPTLEGLDALADVWIRLDSSDLFPGSRVARAWKMLRRGEALYPNSGIRSLAEHIGVKTYEELQIPLRVVASNLRTGKEQVFSTGSLTDTILASTAMPGVFSPVILDGESYVDGGVVNNVPISVAVAAGAKNVYVLNCLPCQRDEQRQIRRPIDVLVQAVTHARASRLHHDLERYADEVQFVIPPVPATNVRFDDNSQAARLIQLGYDNTRSYLAHPANRRRAPKNATVATLPSEVSGI